MSQDRVFKPWVTNISRTLIKQCKINIQHVVYNKNTISVSEVQETSSIERHGGASSDWRKKITVVTNFSQFIRPPGKRVSEADLAFRKQYFWNKTFHRSLVAQGRCFGTERFFGIVSKTLFCFRDVRSVLLKRCFQRGKREIKHFRVYLPSSFRNLPRASTTVYNRTLRSWVWVSFLSLTSLVFTECLIHNLQCEIMWYSVSVRAGGLAVNKNSKQSYSESVMFHLIGDSVRWELTIKVRWGRLLSRRCFSRTPHLLCLWRQTDRQTDLSSMRKLCSELEEEACKNWKTTV